MVQQAQAHSSHGGTDLAWVVLFDLFIAPDGVERSEPD